MTKALKISLAFNLITLIAVILVLINFNVVDHIKLKYKASTVEGNSGFGFAYNTKSDIFKTFPSDTTDIIFLGNSLTEYCHWSELFQNKQIKNRGISGDVIPGVIERVTDITEGNPKKLFLMIGINDLRRGSTIIEIVENYRILTAKIIKESPQTKLYIQSLLPTNDGLNIKNKDILEINKGLQKIANDFQINYIDLFPLFAGEGNKIKSNLTFDGLHINGAGYLIWKDALNDYIQ